MIMLNLSISWFYIYNDGEYFCELLTSKALLNKMKTVHKVSLQG